MGVKALFHDNPPGCDVVLMGGVCPHCEITPDTQSTFLAYQCESEKARVRCMRPRNHQYDHAAVLGPSKLVAWADCGESLIGSQRLGGGTSACTKPRGHTGGHSDVTQGDQLDDCPSRYAGRSKASPDALWRQAQEGKGDGHVVETRFIALMREHGWILDLERIDDDLHKAWGGVLDALGRGDVLDLQKAVTAMAAECAAALARLK